MRDVITNQATNRERLRERLKTVSRGMREELDYLVNGVDREEPGYDIVDAFLDFENKADYPEWGSFRKECRQVLLDIGFYRIMPQAEIDRTYVSSGSKWQFKSKGIAYTADFALYSFFTLEA